jgi:type II secretory pathway predicted ATPase ExeA
LPIGDVWTTLLNCEKVLAGTISPVLIIRSDNFVSGRVVKHTDGVDTGERPFDEKGQPATVVLYRSQQAALKFLRNVLVDAKGVGLLHGPESSGKSVVISQFLDELPKHVATANVDGSRLQAAELLSEILDQFGYRVQRCSVDDLLSMLRVIVVQLTRSYAAPVLVVHNVNDIDPDALTMLCELAGQKIRNQYALRIVLVSDRYFYRIMHSPSMEPLTDRLVGKFEMRPMTSREAMSYIYAKLHSLGMDHPDDLVPIDVCTQLHTAAEGLPGILDDILLAIMDQADAAPVHLEDIDHPALHHQSVNHSVDQSENKEKLVQEEQAEQGVPKLIITRDGKLHQEVELSNARALIGRSGLSDVVIESHFVSRQHALLVRDQGAVVLVDLKSSNGTYVNSRRISSKVLLDNDIIMIGDHRIKMIYASGNPNVKIDYPDVADTVKMKGIADARRAKLRKAPDLTAVDKNKA